MSIAADRRIKQLEEQVEALKASRDDLLARVDRLEALLPEDEPLKIPAYPKKILEAQGYPEPEEPMPEPEEADGNHRTVVSSQ